MEATPAQGSIEAVTMSEILGLDTWNQSRSTEQLQSFIERRHAAIGEVDLEE